MQLNRFSWVLGLLEWWTNIKMKMGNRRVSVNCGHRKGSGNVVGMQKISNRFLNPKFLVGTRVPNCIKGCAYKSIQTEESSLWDVNLVTLWTFNPYKGSLYALVSSKILTRKYYQYFIIHSIIELKWLNSITLDKNDSLETRLQLLTNWGSKSSFCIGADYIYKASENNNRWLHYRNDLKSKNG